MIVLNEDNLIFLGERNDDSRIWQLPQGGIDEGETPEENVLRELQEELGAPRRNFDIIKRLEATHTYDFQRIPPYAIGRYRGQTQTFWLVRYTGSLADIDLSTGEPEFLSFQWCTPEEVRAKCDPIRRPGYEAPLKEVEAFLRNPEKS